MILSVRSNILFPLGGIKRACIGTDGVGVRSLVFARGCPLRCKMCFNKVLLDIPDDCNYVSVESLYKQLEIDDLYFKLTGGGITFGGGEPMLYSKFIRSFAEYATNWSIVIETSLNVVLDNLIDVVGFVDAFYVDIKDMNSDIYKDYTDKDNVLVLKNLEYLASNVDLDTVMIRLPEIKDFNSLDDIRYSHDFLSNLGFYNFDVFKYREV